MNPERKMMLAVVLLLLAEQDALNVEGVDLVEALQIAHEATELVASEDFDVLCELIDAKPKLARAIDPSTAMYLFKQLMGETSVN